MIYSDNLSSIVRSSIISTIDLTILLLSVVLIGIFPQLFSLHLFDHTFMHLTAYSDLDMICIFTSSVIQDNALYIACSSAF